MPSIGTLLVDSGVISQKQLDEALQCQVLFGGSIGTNLLELGYASEDTLATLLARQLGVETLAAGDLDDIPPKIISLVPAHLAHELCAIPVRESGKGLVVAMADPRDRTAVTDLERLTGMSVVPTVVVEARLAYLLERYYGIKGEHRYVSLIRNLSNQEVSRGSSPSRGEPPELPASQEGATGRFDRMAPLRAHKQTVSRIGAVQLDEMLSTAQNRDDVAQVILSYAQNYLRRACLLVIKRDIAYGWAGYGEGIDPAAVRGIMVPLSERSVFRTAYETRAPLIGPMADTPVNRRFLAAFGGQKPETVLLVPIAYGESPIALLYGDNGDKKGVPPKHVSELQILSGKVARTFQQIIERLRRKI